MADELLNTEQMAALLDMSPQRLRELTRRGVVPKAGHGRYLAAEAVPAYCRHIREMAAGRAADGEGLDLVEERAKLARAQRVKTELDIATTRRALVPAREAEEQGRALARIIVTALDNLPDRLADELAGTTDPHTVERLLRAETENLIQDIRRAHWKPSEQPRTVTEQTEPETEQ